MLIRGVGVWIFLILTRMYIFFSTQRKKSLRTPSSSSMFRNILIISRMYIFFGNKRKKSIRTKSSSLRFRIFLVPSRMYIFFNVKGIIPFVHYHRSCYLPKKFGLEKIAIANESAGNTSFPMNFIEKPVNDDCTINLVSKFSYFDLSHFPQT